MLHGLYSNIKIELLEVRNLKMMNATDLRDCEKIEEYFFRMTSCRNNVFSHNLIKAVSGHT